MIDLLTVFAIVGAVWGLAVAYAAWRLWTLSTRPPRPISEHTDDWYRPHNGANGRSFR